MDNYSDLELKTYIESDNNDEQNELMNGEIHSKKYIFFLYFYQVWKEYKDDSIKKPLISVKIEQ